jgi:hypothetical protein
MKRLFPTRKGQQSRRGFSVLPVRRHVPEIRRHRPHHPCNYVDLRSTAIGFSTFSFIGVKIAF